MAGKSSAERTQKYIGLGQKAASETTKRAEGAKTGVRKKIALDG